MGRKGMKRWQFGALVLLTTVMACVDSASRKAQEPPITQEPKAVTAMRRRIPRLKESLEAIRQLKFKEPVKLKYQSQKAFAGYVQESLKHEYPGDKMERYERMLIRAGLLKSGTKLRTSLMSMLDSQTMAHYSPSDETFYLLQTDASALELDITVVHELQHALQDQHFGLGELIEEAMKAGDEDRANALKFVFEGEATYVMTVFALRQAGLGEDAVGRPLRANAKLNRKQTLVQMSQQPMTEKQMKSMAALESAPLYLYRVMSDPYSLGAVTILEVKKRGGWAAVKALFDHPPSSTEQVLHPEKLSPPRDEPTPVRLLDVSKHFGPGWSLADQNTVGELCLNILFELWVKDQRDSASAGWDGDRLVSYERKVGDKVHTAIVWQLVFDSDKDAKEFAVAYAKLQRAKYKLGAMTSVHGEIRSQTAGEEHLICLKNSGVLIIEGAPPGRLDAIKAGLSTTTKPQTTPQGKSE